MHNTPPSSNQGSSTPLEPLQLKPNTFLSRLAYDIRRSVTNALIIGAVGLGSGYVGGKMSQGHFRDETGYDPSQTELVDRRPVVEESPEEARGLWEGLKHKSKKILERAKKITDPAEAKKYLTEILSPLLQELLGGVYRWGDNMAFWIAFMPICIASAFTTKYLLGIIQMSAEDEINKANDGTTQAKINEIIEAINRLSPNGSAPTTAQIQQATQTLQSILQGMPSVTSPTAPKSPAEGGGEDNSGGSASLF